MLFSLDPTRGSPVNPVPFGSELNQLYKYITRPSLIVLDFSGRRCTSSLRAAIPVLTCAPGAASCSVIWVARSGSVLHWFAPPSPAVSPLLFADGGRLVLFHCSVHSRLRSFASSSPTPPPPSFRVRASDHGRCLRFRRPPFDRRLPKDARYHSRHGPEARPWLVTCILLARILSIRSLTLACGTFFTR